MKSKYLVALANPRSEADDEAFNVFYNETHLPEVCALPGFISARRFLASARQTSEEPPKYQYVTIYNLADVDTAIDSLGRYGSDLTPFETLSDDMHLVVVDEIFSYNNERSE